MGLGDNVEYPGFRPDDQRERLPRPDRQHRPIRSNGDHIEGADGWDLPPMQLEVDPLLFSTEQVLERHAEQYGSAGQAE
jgi:hypothetical protein